MPRLPSTTVLSLWLGFHAAVGAALLARAMGADPGAFSAHAGAMVDAVARSASPAGLAVLHLGLAALFAVALATIHSRDAGTRRRGEVISFSAVGVSTATVVAAFFGGPFAEVFTDPGHALAAVVVSLAMLAFDRLVETPEDDEDDAAFYRTARMIQSSIPPRSAESERPATRAGRGETR